MQADLEKQIAELKAQIAKMSETLTERASEAADSASEIVDDFRDRTTGAARQVRQQAHAVGELIHENPGTAATVLSSAGLLGGIIGFAVGYMCSNHSRRW